MKSWNPQANEIFVGALELASPEDRRVYLDRACGSDAGLRQAVDKLLEAHQDAGSFLEVDGSTGAPDREDCVTEGPGSLIGPYKLLQQIGEGGFGVVHMAEQTEPVQRRVAIKIIKPGMDSRQVIARFEAERQALAMMDHQNIAAVLDAGTTDTGRPYFVMELVRGVPINEYCDQNKLTPRQRLELFVPVCRAIQHAHQKGIIHRDVKPTNVMVTMHDGDPVPKVIDFGVAKATQQRLTERTMFTQFGQVIGTLEYMSPEQSEMSGLDVDTRTDVYSLGVLLYELLTGSTPIERGQFRRAAWDEILRLIREQEPARPSVRLSTSGDQLATICAQRRIEPKKLNALLQGELDWIVMKSLEKDRTRRYETANGLAADIQRYLNDDPVTACPPSVRYRLRKFCRKNKGIIAAASTLAVVLLIASILSSWLALKAKRAESLAREERSSAQQSRDAAVIAQRREADQRADAEAARADAFEARDESRQRLVQLHVATGARLMDQGQLLGSLPWFAEALALDEAYPARQEIHRTRIATVMEQCPKLIHVWLHSGVMHVLGFTNDGRRVVTVGGKVARVWDTVSGAALAALEHQEAVYHASFSSDGLRVCTASADKTVLVWDVATAKTVAGPFVHEEEVYRAEFSTDGRLVVSASLDKTAVIWDAKTGDPQGSPLQHEGLVIHASFSPDDRYVVTASDDHTAKVWESATGKPVATLKHDDSVIVVAFSPRGDRVVTGSYDHTARVWDIATGEPVTPPLLVTNIVLAVEFSPDGRRVATAGNAAGSVWDAATGELISRVKHDSYVMSTTFSPDGRHVVSSGWDQMAKIWEADDGDFVMGPLRHPGIVLKAAFSPNGRHLVTATDRGVIRVWDLATSHTKVPSLRHDDVVYHASFSADGKRLATSSLDRTARIWDALEGVALTPPLRHRYAVLHASFSPDGRYLLTASGDENLYGRPGGRGEARVWNAATGELALPPLVHEGSVCRAVYDASGTRILTATGTKSRFHSPRQGDARLWEASTGKLLAVLEHERCVRYAEFSADGRYVATASDDGTARIWDAHTGASVGEPLQHPHRVPSASLSPDGRLVATASWSPGFDERGTAQVWDTLSGQPVCPPVKHEDGVLFVSFSPAGGRIATASEDFTARIWDAATGEPVVPPLRHTNHVYQASFSKDGRLLLTASRDGKARVWDATSGQPVTPLLTHGKHGASVRHAEFSDDGRRLVTTCLDGTVQIWNLPADRYGREDLIELAHLRAGHKVDPTGGMVPLETDTLVGNLQRLRSAHPQHFVPSAKELLAWHRREAEECQRTKHWAAAARHLEAALQRQPAEWTVHAQCGEVESERGDWGKADEFFSRAILLGADVERIWHQQAHARLANQDLEGYQRSCQDLFARFSPDGYAATTNRVAWTSVLAADAHSPELLTLVERAAKAHAEDPSHLTALGAMLYRAGRYEEAVARLQEAASLQTEDSERAMADFIEFVPGRGHTSLVLAMAYARRNDMPAARATLAHALDHKPGESQDVWYRISYRLLLEQTRALLSQLGDEE